jgi:diguanylate cyclase (GGDEF)-like protein
MPYLAESPCRYSSVFSSSAPDHAAPGLPPAALDRVLANERMIDGMMLTLASVVLTLVLVTSIAFQVAGAVRLSAPFYVTTATYLAVTIVAGRAAPRMTTRRELEWLRWTALVITTAAMLSMSYFLGGANWIGAQPLFFLVFGCTFTPKPWRACIIAATGIGGFVALSALTGTGVIPAQDPLGASRDALSGTQLAATIAYTTLALMLFFVMSAVIAFFLMLQRDALSSTTAELEESKRALERLNPGLEERVAAKTHELEERYREQHVMAELGKIVNASLDIDQVYLEYMDEVRKLVPFDQASIAVFSADRTRMRLLRAIVNGGEVEGTSFELDPSRALSMSGKSRLFDDFGAQDPAWLERDYLVEQGMMCGASVPIVSHDAQLGSFNVVAATPGAYDERRLALLERIVEPLALAMENARLYDEMRAIADTDGLTGLPNRRSLERTLEHEIARAVRNGGQCSVLVMDIDNFKTFNDTLGHQAGDDLLVQFGRMLRDTCRETDVVGRQSGDEFTVVLPDTRSEDAFALAQRIHDAARHADWKYPGDRGTNVTTSIGVATYPYDGAGGETLLSRADSAMYVAKSAGGGQTRLSSDIVDDAPATERRQVRFALVEALAGAAADRMSGDDAPTRTLTAFTARAAIQIAEQLALGDAEQRTLRIAAMSHALAIFPVEDPYAEEQRWGLDDELDEIYLKLGRLFVAASPGHDETLHTVHYLHRPAGDLQDNAEMMLARVLAVAEAYARLTMPGADPQLSPADAFDTLRADPALDQSMVAALAGAIDVETAGRAA